MDDTKLLRPWVLGGDSRYYWAVKALRESGLPVKTWGVSGMKQDADHLQDALQGANMVLLPMKPFRGEMLCIGEEQVEAALLPRMVEKNTVLIAGSFPEEQEAWLQSQGLFCRSFLELESYQMSNAAVTAEGAIFLVLRELQRTVFGAEVLVIGWGRIGRFLAEKLKGLGAHVTVSARRESQWTEIEALGMRPEETGVFHHGLKDYDVVLNTVPARVMAAEQGQSLREDCVLVELASLPGGFAPEIQEKRNIVMAQGLPGKTAPKTAGENLASAVWACLAGEGRTLE